MSASRAARRPQRTLACLLLAVAAGMARSEPTDRGALLYANHCVECHTMQMHWRAQRLAHDWSTLREQVMRWQGRALLQWSDEDIDTVTRHLNDSVYHFPIPEAKRDPSPPR